MRLKDLKKGGFTGANAMYKLKMMFGAALLISLAVLSSMLVGELGIATGISLAIIPALSIKMPDNASDSEKAFVNSLTEGLNTVFQKFESNQITKDKMIEEMQSQLKSWADENSISKEMLDKLATSLKEQGEVLRSLKDSPLKKKAGGLKSAFYDNFDKLVTAIKNKQVNFCVKAVSEHTAADIHTTTNTITTTTGAFLPEQVGTSDEVFLKRRGKQYIHDIANVTVMEEVPEVYNFYEEGDEKGAIAVVTENGLKPQVKLSLVKNQVEAKKAAGYIVVTEELMKWRSRAWAAIQRLFSDKVWRDYEKLLTTDLLTNATSYVNSAFDDSIENPTDLDAIIASVAQLEALNYSPDVLIVNPNDKWKLAMTESKNGTLILPYIQNGGEFGLLGLRVITTTEITAGTFIVGESSTWFVEEEQPKLRTGLVNDDLIYNRMTIIGELFFLSYVPSNNAGSFVKATFASVKEALKTPSVTPGS